MNKNKDKVQKIAESKWISNNYKGALGLCTGAGKSKIFINIISNTPEKWLLVVPTRKLRDKGWRDEFKKWKKLTVFNNYVDKCCYASLKNYDLSKYRGVCLDEGHNITTNNIKPFFKNNIYVNLKLLFLSATIPNDFVKINLMNSIDLNPIYTLSLDEGVEMGLVAPYKIKIIKVPLDKNDNIAVKYKKKGQEYTFYTSEYNNYNYLTKTISKKLDEGKDAKFNFFNRMRFIYNLNSKKIVADKILSLLNKKDRTLIFSQSIKQIESLCSCVYHSKTNSDCYDDFINEKLNELGVVMSVNEGTNIPNLDNSVIVQLTSKDKDLIQRIGRIVRYREGHIANIYIIVSEGTVDENWVNQSLESFNKTNIEFIDYTQLMMKNKL